MLTYLSEGLLPKDNKHAKELALTKSQYTLVDQALYHVERDNTLRLIPPSLSRERLFTDVHSGPYGAHLHEAKVHGQLSKHYWWNNMQSDVKKSWTTYKASTCANTSWRTL